MCKIFKERLLGSTKSRRTLRGCTTIGGSCGGRCSSHWRWSIVINISIGFARRPISATPYRKVKIFCVVFQIVFLQILSQFITRSKFSSFGTIYICIVEKKYFMIGGKSIFRGWIETDRALIRILKVHLLPHFKPKFLKKADTKWKKNLQ